MRAPGGGSIVNLTSVEAHRAAPNHAVYAAMKAAVTSLGEPIVDDYLARRGAAR